MSKKLRQGRGVLEFAIPDSQQVRGAGALSVLMPQGVEVNETGAQFPEDFPLELWVEFGRKLYQVGQSYQWVVADWVRFGERKYGEKYQQALEQTGFSYGTLRNMVSVAGKIEMSRRRDNLPFSHHVNVVSLPLKQQERLLKKAENNNWSNKQLREEVKRVKSQEISSKSVDEDHPLLAYVKQAEKYVLRVQEKDVPALKKEEARLLIDVVTEIEQSLAQLRAAVSQHHDV